jgi:hypothetical protein
MPIAVMAVTLEEFVAWLESNGEMVFEQFVPPKDLEVPTSTLIEVPSPEPTVPTDSVEKKVDLPTKLTRKPWNDFGQNNRSSMFDNKFKTMPKPPSSKSDESYDWGPLKERLRKAEDAQFDKDTERALELSRKQLIIDKKKRVAKEAAAKAQEIAKQKNNDN